MRKWALVALAAWLGLVAIPASADPILDVTPSTIDLSPSLTVITLQVDPADTPLSALVLTLSGLASGLEIVGIAPLDPFIFTSGPTLTGGNWEASFGGFFPTDRTGSFAIGTVTVRGLTPGTDLVLTGDWTGPGPGFPSILIPPTIVGTVVSTPEPTTGALLSLGLLALAGWRRRG